MNKDEVYNRLLELGMAANLGDYYVVLATKLALAYQTYFRKVFTSLLKEQNYDTLEKTRLPLNAIKDFTEQDKKELAFSNKQKFIINDTSYFIVNLKNEVLYYVLNGKKILLKNVYSLNEFLNVTGLKDEDFVIKEYYKRKEKLSLMYSYAYSYLVLNANNNDDLALAGCFQNAYYDIITFLEKQADLCKVL